MSDADVRILQLPHGADLPLPSYQSAHAAGLDLLAAVPDGAPLTLAPGARALVPTGLAIALPPDCEVQVLLINLGDKPVAIARGMRIAQMIVARVVRARLAAVASLDITQRGAGGFGSTGS